MWKWLLSLCVLPTAAQVHVTGVLCSSCWALSQRQEGWALWLKHKAQGPQAYIHYLWHPRDAHDTTQPPQPRQSWADPRLGTATGDNPRVLGCLAGPSQHQREGDLLSLTWAVRNKWVYFKTSAVVSPCFGTHFAWWGLQQFLLSQQQMPTYEASHKEDIFHSGKWQNSVFRGKSNLESMWIIL